MKKPKTLSIVTSTYNSESEIKEFIKRSLDTVNLLNVTLDQLIIVDDGSTDSTLKILESETKKNSAIQTIELTRNFGQHEALLVGLSKSKSDFVYLTDSDLEEAPENLEVLLKELIKSNVDVVYGVQSKRRGNLAERIEGKFFYHFLFKILGIGVQTDILTSRIMVRNYVDALLEYPEKRVYLGGIFTDVGFTQKSIEIPKTRIKPSRYSFQKKISLTIKLITSFSKQPLKFFSYVAIFQLTSSIIVILALCLRFVITSEHVSGWTSIIVSIWFTTGLIASMVSLMMMYVYEILQEVKNRPRAIIKGINFEKNK